MEIITVKRRLLDRNETIAERNRRVLEKLGVVAVNLVSSPGAGKTTLLERTIRDLTGVVRLAVVEGDPQTDLDARRISRWDVPVVQIVTDGGCHLEAGLVGEAIGRLDLIGTELLMIENVGNLVCTANYDLGEETMVVLVSITEGDDKPLKYPMVFRKSSVMVISKIDLVPYVDASVERLREAALSINPALKIFELSPTTGEGMEEWNQWLRGLVR